MEIDARLLVLLKGTDLIATTTYLTLVGKMGYGEKLAGIKRFDYFRFTLEPSQDDPRATIEAMKTVLDRQSTFYNRNKHTYSLSFKWGANSHNEGLLSEEVEKRWVDELSKPLINSEVTDFNGQASRKPVIFNKVLGFLVEVLVEDEDRSARDSLAGKLQSDLGGIKVACKNRATLWWLALRAQDDKEAIALAKEIAVTRRRDQGLLANPNYQHAEFVSAREIERVKND
jgi:hypothetical protein